MRALVLGASGMLGSAVFEFFSAAQVHETWGTVRNDSARKLFAEIGASQLVSGVDVLNQDALLRVMLQVRPDVVLNCVGLIKQLSDANDPLLALPINSLLPHRMADLCELFGARLIHISTDCVFTGRKGSYTEDDVSDAVDLYGKSKYIGEVHGKKNAITLRTSIIGHELNSNHSLVDWFLGQESFVHGYTKAIFSGLPTVELARVIHDIVVPNPELCGLYHISAAPISKFELLTLIASTYGRKTKIVPSEDVVIDRSLNSEKFTKATGYVAPDWRDLIELMHRTR